MFASLARIAVLIGLGISAWVFYPKYKPVIEPIIGKPEVLGAQILHPAIKTINDILPDNLQIPTPKPAGETTGDVAGANTSETSNNAVSQIVDEVKQKASEIAKDQIDTAKDEAAKAFCQVLIEKIKTECGQ